MNSKAPKLAPLRAISLTLLLITFFSIIALGQDTPGTVKYPGGLDSQQSLIEVANNAFTNLSGSLDAVSTTINVATSGTAGFPSTGQFTIDAETVYYLGKTSNSFTGCIRGAAGTTATTHSTGAAVRMTLNAVLHQTISAAMRALEAKMGIGVSTPVANSVLLGMGAGTSSWGAVPVGSLFSSGGTPSSSTCYHGDGSWGACGGALSSVFGRTGGVTAQSGDYTASQITNAAATNAANVFSATQTMTSPKIITGVSDTNGNTMLGFSPVSSAVNYLSFSNTIASSGASPTIAAAGSDTNIGVTIQGKGSGGINLLANFLNTTGAMTAPSLLLGTAGTTTGSLVLTNATGANFTGFQAGASAPSLTYVFPTVAPSAGQVLSAAAPSSGNVALSWATGGGGAGTFSPPQSASLKLWLKQDAGLYTDSGCSTAVASDGDSVGCWADQSGNSNNVIQAAGGVQPKYRTNILNGAPAVAFAIGSGTANLATSGSFFDSSFNTAITIFVVRQGVATSLTGAQSVWLSAHNNFLYFDDRRDQSHVEAQVAGLTPDHQQLGYLLPSLEMYKYDGSHVTFNNNSKFVLNTSNPSTTGNLGASGSLMIGDLSLGPGGGNAWSGYVQEVLIYNRALTTNEVSQVQTYLQNKYNLPGVPNSKPIVVFVGDSITQGVPGPSSLSHAYPQATMSMLGSQFDFMNLGAGGYTASMMTTNSTPEDFPLVSSLRTKNIAFVHAGTNDLATGVSVSTTISNINTLCTNLQADGFFVIVSTILPRNIGGFDANRDLVNASIRQNYKTYADGLADFAADGIIGPDGVSTNSTYYNGGVHPTDAGATIMASIANTAILQALNRAPVYYGTVSTGFAAYTGTSGGTTLLNLATGNYQAFTFGAGNATLTLQNVPAGAVITLAIIQDSSGSRTLTWPSTIKWVGGSAPTLSTAASARDQFVFTSDGTNLYEISRALNVH